MISASLEKSIEKRIKNFLGYGNPHSLIWLIGMEEGAKPNGNEKHYESLFSKVDNKTFADISNTEYPFWGRGFYHLYRLLLILNREPRAFTIPVNKKDKSNKLTQLTDVMGKEDLADQESNLLLEFNPILFYEGKSFLWNEYVKRKYDTRKNFLEAISSIRAELIRKNVKQYTPKKIIFYGLSYSTFFRKVVDQDFEEIKLTQDRILHSQIDQIPVFVIPHCSGKITNKRYKEIAEEILKH